jgi:hypothetical protein
MIQDTYTCPTDQSAKKEYAQKILLLIFSSFSLDFGKLGNRKFPGHVYNTIFVKLLDMYANRPTYRVSFQHLYLTSR